MPKNKQPAGRALPEYVMNSMGVWVRSKFAGMRVGKNTNVSDYGDLHIVNRHKRKTHTSPVVRTEQNSGAGNPTRMRHAATKAMHGLRRIATAETSF